MSFDTLGLSPAVLRALADQNFTNPTPIQAQAIPHVLAGHDLLAGAQTGTGKTAAFGLPMLDMLAHGEVRAAGPKRPRALVLTPTRELALQVHDNLRAYGRHLRLSTLAIFGGAGMTPQLDALRRGVDVLVATPGRLIDHIDRRSVDLSHIQVLVLDEADRMLDMGFLPAIRRILGRLPSNRQTLLFSATFDAPIKALAKDFMRPDPREVQIAANNAVADTVTHRVHPVDAPRKRDLLLHLLGANQDQTLVFARTKHGSDKLARFLAASGITVDAIHGNKSQGARTRALKDFKSGRTRVLVATDIAARGLDIHSLPRVINFDLPMVAEDYVHRIGRTGRNGAKGEALSLVAADEAKLLRAIQRLIRCDIELSEVEGYAPQAPLRLDSGDSRRRAPGTPAGQRPPRKQGRRPHPQPQGHAHAGPRQKSPGEQRGRRGGQRSQAPAR
ncbi:DEAD/DEAH box helicase [Coralloluteibacterium stylophorae]|uniref:DEAD-box ATP-dependent RNA helicase RhpA n=1 Tax=Coralloluteibacterium stylophorae TaxID=1776034 RepID=A0A8J7VV79_9GAMM|nr:DEAD/DEAH box helicase [Coralloluteibacterium stylophorae]MBS7456464.1 DEAD/DEAH box helicase [Coralloluteibacterium stylophorae]